MPWRIRWADIISLEGANSVAGGPHGKSSSNKVRGVDMLAESEPDVTFLDPLQASEEPVLVGQQADAQLPEPHP